MFPTCPTTQFSPSVGGACAIRTFSGLSATHTTSPGFASVGESARSRPAAALAITVSDAPTSTTRPSIRLISPIKSATQREPLLDSRLDFRLGKPLLLEPECHIALDREMRKQRVVLEHHVDRPPIRRYLRNILTIEQNASFVGHVQTGEEAQQRGLAAARRAEQGEEFAGENVERHALDRSYGRKLLAHAVEPHQRTRSLVCPPRERSAPALLVRVVPRIGAAVPHAATLAAQDARLNLPRASYRDWSRGGRACGRLGSGK